MANMSEPDLTSKERAAAVTWRIAQGARLTTSEIAREYEITRRGAARLMNELSQVIPIVRSFDGRWCKMDLVFVGSAEGGSSSEGGAD